MSVARLAIALLGLPMLVGCASTTRSPISNADMSSTLELIVTELQPGHYRVEVDARLDGRLERFLLDTGARTTTLVSNEATSRYRVVGTTESKGVTGVGAPCDEIVIDEIAVGPLRAADFRAHRCRADGTRNLIALDFFGDRSLEIDLRHRRLTVRPAGSASIGENKVVRLKAGHLTIPARFGDTEAAVLFDTGADTTVVDAQFVATHPTLFIKKRAEEGRDSSGAPVASDVYALRSLEIGGLRVENVEVAAIDFSPHMRSQLGAGTPAILGTNVIARGVWTFDLKQNVWRVRAN